MRHQVQSNRLNRTSEHRKALLKNLSRALIANGRIRTTLPKARALRPFIEKLVTKARQGHASGDPAKSVHKRRLIFSHLQDKKATHVLFEQIAPRFLDRPGGYTRIVKAGNRPGDGAPMAYIEFVDVMDAKEAMPEVEEKSALRRGLDQAKKK
jgi:large subunit ribosomal protein L17